MQSSQSPRYHGSMSSSDEEPVTYQAGDGTEEHAREPLSMWVPPRDLMSSSRHPPMEEASSKRLRMDYHHKRQNPVDAQSPQYARRDDVRGHTNDQRLLPQQMSTPALASSSRQPFIEQSLRKRSRVSEDQDSPDATDVHLRQHFGQSDVRGHARVQFGHQYYKGPVHQHLHAAPPPNSELQIQDEHTKLLEALQFDQMDARHATINAALARTCGWLLDRIEYKDWRDASKRSSLLYVKGKPGAGKSTVMKYILNHAMKTMSDEIIISFFFNARGDALEQSIEGMFRSLLHQLLSKLPRLSPALNVRSHKHIEQHRWPIQLLKDMFQQAIMMLGKDRLTCYIDALDEGQEEEIRDMIGFFEELGESAIEADVLVNICFSSRHYPHITIENCQSLILEGQEGHEQDIIRYVQSRLKAGKAKVHDEIRTKIYEKASGVFLWVVLVVRILNEDYDRGNIHKLKTRLAEIPEGLDNLFQDILQRGMQDNTNLVITLQWILFARRPLRPEELYFAVLRSLDHDVTPPWDPEEVDYDAMKRFILNASKGLAEMTKAKQPTVQFIHESVRDYLIHTGLGTLEPALSANLVGLSHDHLKRCCEDYFALGVLSQLFLPSPLPNAKNTAQLRDEAKKAYPFLEYAHANVLHHADIAHDQGIPQHAFVAELPLPAWIVLNNLLEKHTIRRYSDVVPKLYLFAEKGLQKLCEVELMNKPIFIAETERYKSALGAALARNHVHIIDTLFASHLKLECQANCIECLESAIEKDNMAIVERLLQRGTAPDMKDEQKERLLQLSIVKDRTEIFKVLLAHGFSVMRQPMHDNVLYTAISNDREEIVQVLLDHGMDPNAQHSSNSKNWTPLDEAAEQGNYGIVKMLLDKGAAIKAEGRQGLNGLQVAAKHGWTVVVQLLLDNGADVHTQAWELESALISAAVNGHEMTVQLLLDRGADADADNAYDFYMVVKRGNEKIKQLLLDNGANINARHGGFEPLHLAAREGHEKIVHLLLDNGAAMYALSTHWRSALREAVLNRREKIVQRLIIGGTDVNADEGHRGAALQAAAAYGYDQTMQQLIDGGADVNAQGGWYGTALMAAVCGNHATAVQMLLDHGAELSVALDSAPHCMHEQDVSKGRSIIKRMLQEHQNRNVV